MTNPTHHYRYSLILPSKPLHRFSYLVIPLCLVYTYRRI